MKARSLTADEKVARFGPDAGPLRQVLETAARGSGLTFDLLTVLAEDNDPYRQDTPAGHRDGRWLATQLKRCLEESGKYRIHFRGLHYWLVSSNVRKPNGVIYLNTEEDWTWLQNDPGKAARWLGYVPFSSIVDERNQPPRRHRQRDFPSWTNVHHADLIELPSDGVYPVPNVYGLEGRQPYHLVLFGEKSSLSDILFPIAEDFQADAYVMAGGLSDTYLHLMAEDGANDGRVMHIFTVSDSDPSGYQMPISIARKMQAFRDLEFPALRFQVHPIALMPHQVRAMDLPESFLKEKEKRAGAWRAAFGTEQTEIDALASVQPETLRRMVTDALTPFFDATLANRNVRRQRAWEKLAKRKVKEQTDQATIDDLEARIETLREEVESLNEAMEELAEEDFTLPPTRAPQAKVDEALLPKPLVSSDQSWVEITRTLIDRKRYKNNGHTP